ncbi:MAG: maleylpyruvate isomerase family mycothiol-dependent enzyme [Nocardioides sp.]
MDRMDKEAIFGACTRMRHDTADWLETLDEAALDTPSLCSGWAVRGVAGHLIASVSAPLSQLLLHTVRSGFNPHRANVTMGRERGAHTGPDLATTLRRHADVELSVPVVGVHGPFTDLVVHNADMRVPLGAPWEPDPVWATECLAFVGKGALGFTARKRLAGLRLVATDSSYVAGQGAELSGPAYSLLLALCGRAVGLERLDGPGRDLLAARL